MKRLDRLSWAATWAGVAAFVWYAFGVSSAFWAIIAGVAASALAERQQLLEFWREGGAADQLPPAQTSCTTKR